MDRRTTIRVSRAVLAAALLLLTLPAPGRAHPILRAALPSEGARLEEIPVEIRLHFSEGVEPALARITLTGPGGRLFQIGSIVRPGDSTGVLSAPVQGDWVAGDYTLRWTITGADGHPVPGELRFAIAPGAAGLTPPAISGGVAPDTMTHHPGSTFPEGADFGVQSPLYVAVRWLSFIGILGIVGAAVFATGVLPRAVRSLVDLPAGVSGEWATRTARLGLLAAGTAAVGAVLRLAAQSYALGGGGLLGGAQGALLGTLWGRAWLIQLVAIGLAAAGFAAARRGVDVHAPGSGREGDPRGRPHAGWMVATVAALLVSLATALSGHAASGPGSKAAAVLADTAHIVGAGGWIGSLAVLVFAGLPVTLALDARTRSRAVAVLVGSFSPVALILAALTVVTGVFSATLHLDSVASLWSGGYGRVLLVKVGLLALLFAVAAFNWRRVKPTLAIDEGASRLGVSASVEVAIGVAILLVTAVLVATPPSAG